MIFENVGQIRDSITKKKVPKTLIKLIFRYSSCENNSKINPHKT